MSLFKDGLKQDWELGEVIIENLPKISQSLECISKIITEKRCSSLFIHKIMKKEKKEYRIPYELICYNSVDAFIKNASDKEYEIIAEKCIDVYLSVDECDLVKLSDVISEKYSLKEFNLNELKEMGKYEILNIYNNI